MWEKIMSSASENSKPLGRLQTDYRWRKGNGTGWLSVVSSETV